MLSLSNILTPLAGEIGIGGVGGFVVGYAIKKVAKILAVAIGLGFLALQYLAYIDVITINYGELREWAESAVAGSSGAQRWIADLLVHAPFGAAFACGLYLGLRKG